MHDFVIRGATVVDGLGHDPIRADLAVRDGRIATIGDVGKDALEIVDAGGLALMPGIIDLHTHYDAQVTWDPSLSPSQSSREVGYQENWRDAEPVFTLRGARTVGSRNRIDAATC
jgi:N-acyl-D-aspartate/D-glutamate deacylase